MKIVTIESGPLYTNAYLVIDTASHHAVVIDAPKDCTEEIAAVAAAERLTIDRVLLTHSHWDHTADAAALKERFHVPVIVHISDEYRMRDPRGEMLQPPFSLEPLAADGHVAEGDQITVGSLTARVLCTPGHTEGGVCFYFEQEGVVFTGDTLFAGSVGRTDFPGGSWETLMRSLHTVLMTLPDKTVVYPGHGAPTTIAHEKLLNPFVNGEIEGP